MVNSEKDESDYVKSRLKLETTMFSIEHLIHEQGENENVTFANKQENMEQRCLCHVGVAVPDTFPDRL